MAIKQMVLCLPSSSVKGWRFQSSSLVIQSQYAKMGEISGNLQVNEA